jgi:hypothetical protein
MALSDYPVPVTGRQGGMFFPRRVFQPSTIQEADDIRNAKLARSGYVRGAA